MASSCLITEIARGKLWSRPLRKTSYCYPLHRESKQRGPCKQCGCAHPTRPILHRRSNSKLSVSENLDEIRCRIIGLTLVLTLPYATHMFAYAVHLEQEGLTQTLRDACFAQNAADTTTRAYALHTLYNGHLLHLIFGYGC